ncbi:unnamed protein product [Paramecium primaurelia]|uniref:Uncharacterized protein n=1 Tax=Paramecium primaurelia TaxID=5886 RepID=A0A8S1PSP2_PARPR|nr:unnamed protein product [Paramecium primaurelia]
MKMMFIISVIYAYLKNTNTLIKEIEGLMNSQKVILNNIRDWEIIKSILRQFGFDRLLSTKDIEGAVPGSLQSQAVRNQEIAKKLRLEREIQNKSCNHSQIDEFTKEENYLYSGRDRSNIFQTNCFQKNSEKSSQLPPIERISDKIDHVANKLQLRQPRKSFQLEDFRLKNKQALLRIFI